MSIVFLYFIAVVLLSRIVFELLKVKNYKFLIKGVLEVFLLSFMAHSMLELLLITVLIVLFNLPLYDIYQQNKEIETKNVQSFLLLILYIVFFSFLINKNSLIIDFNKPLWSLVDLLREYNAFLLDIEFVFAFQILLYFIGSLLMVYEINHVIRYILHQVKVEPKPSSANKETEKIDQEELNRGKIIGIIERIIIYFLTITNNISAIGFIIAAKTFARYKQLDDKDFAEYVLIGTLLSCSISVFVGLIIKF